MKKSLTLVVAVYNAVRYLELLFAALLRQSMNDFEVIVADDGSGPEIRKLIETVTPQSSFPIIHLWHEDAGFRKNVMLNKAINASQTDYLVFIDGDCLPHRQFLHDHSQNRRPNSLLCGRRVNLSKDITDRLTLEDVRSGRYEKLSWALLFDGLLARSTNLEDAVRIENGFIRRLLHRNKARILGCNFSVEKKLLERINGFNEDYRAPGLGEDSDIAFRLALTGVQLMSLRYLAVLLHLYHPRTVVEDANKELYERVLASQNALCRNGLREIEHLKLSSKDFGSQGGKVYTKS
ncbi:MAG: glycosyltransferase [Ignavibacteriae bacterium]|nr:glycosyltransferase [Ignavibacteriota bacterium]